MSILCSMTSCIQRVSSKGTALVTQYKHQCNALSLLKRKLHLPAYLMNFDESNEIPCVIINATMTS